MTQPIDRPTAPVPASPEDLAATIPDGLIGATLNDTYTVVRFLAEGGMGRVYEAQHTRIATKRFAIKVLHSDLKHSMDVRLRFRREAEAAASINHPSVVGVQDLGYTLDGRPYLVCDYLQGHDLASLIDKGEPLSIHLSTSIVRQLCRALEAAHDRGVIHRDLKPANVFLVGPQHEPEVKVLDFGLSKIVELADASVTQTGAIMGTPSYMAPEQAKSEPTDHRVDVYGAGAVLYAALTGKPPFEEDSPHQTVLAVMTRDPPGPRTLVPSIPPELEVVVQKAMAREPSERYNSMRDLEIALEPWAAASAVSVRGTTQKSPSVRPTPMNGDAGEARGVRRRATTWLAFSALLLLFGALSAALGLYDLLSHGRKLLPSELLLVSLAVFGSLLTPGILFVLWLRRRYWGNSARMITLVSAVRGPALTGAAVYGVAALLGRVLDVAARFFPSRGPAPNASGWIGWSPFLFGVGFFAATAAIVRHRILAPSNSLMRRVLGGPILIGLVACASGALLSVGYQMSSKAKPSETLRPAASVTADEKKPPVVPHPPDSQQLASASASHAIVEPKAPAVAADRAPDDELARAKHDGTEALTALQARFPKDPRVLKPLALDLAKEPERASEMLRVLDTLFTVAPDETQDQELGTAMRAVVLVPAMAQRAIDLMQRMGPQGAEMLFDLVLKEPELRARARAALETAEVQRTLTPALKIAYDLQTAPSCAAREELLPQAVRDGDERTITVLTMATAKTIRGCGPKKKLPCPALCAAQTAAFDQAMQQIKTRLAASASP